jgi:signal transduction histidine kinase
LTAATREAARLAQDSGEPQRVDLRVIDRADVGRRQLLALASLAEALVVPLSTGTRVIGMLTLARRVDAQPFGPGDTALAVEFGRRVAGALESSLLHAEVVNASRAKDEFLARVSHELRTPLAAVFMWVGALRSATDAAAIERALDAIELAVRLQSRLVEDLVDLARSTAGKLSLALSAVDVEAAVVRAVDTHRPEAASRSVTIEIERARRCGTVWADEQRLGQIMTNLLSNAIKYSADGGRIIVRLDCDGEDVVIRVSDNGQGIPAELLPLVFEPFRQGEDQVDRGAGLGLGLAVVKQLVLMHGGSVTAASAGRGQGAEFTVRLPVLQNVDGAKSAT